MDRIEFVWFCIIFFMSMVSSAFGGILYYFQTPYGTIFLATGSVMMFFVGTIFGYSKRREMEEAVG